MTREQIQAAMQRYVTDMYIARHPYMTEMCEHIADLCYKRAARLVDARTCKHGLAAAICELSPVKGDGIGQGEHTCDTRFQTQFTAELLGEMESLVTFLEDTADTIDPAGVGRHLLQRAAQMRAQIDQKKMDE